MDMLSCLNGKFEIRISKSEIHPVESSEGGPPVAAFRWAGPNPKWQKFKSFEH
jgi:hypothetical protein